MKKIIFEKKLFDRIKQIGAESDGIVNVFINPKNFRNAYKQYFKGLEFYDTNLAFGSIDIRLIDKLEQFVKINDISVWDADSEIIMPEFEKHNTNKMTDILSFIDNPEGGNVVEIPQKYKEGVSQHIVVIDSTCDINHPYYKNNIFKTLDFTKDRDFSVGKQDHATHICGIIKHIVPRAKISIFKVFDKHNICTRKSIVDAIYKAVQLNADVINGSWGEKGCMGNCPVDRAVSYAVKNGVMFVGSAGNSGMDGKNSLTCPAGNLDIITVGACDMDGKVADFSSQGPSYKDNKSIKPDITAPGKNISSCKPGGGYQLMSGTSMAAPVVTGAFARIKSISLYLKNNL